MGDFGNVQMNKRIFKSQTLDSGDVPFYKIGTFGKKADAYISSELYEEYRNKYPYPKDGDLLISASGSIGKIVEYKGQRAYYQDSNIVWLDHDNRILNLFLKAFFQIVKWNGTEGSTIKRLYNKNILNTEIILPKIKEQTAVGKLIETFDYLITLQQRKLKQLKQLKKAMLQQLFVDKNCKQPILRFKNFNDNWEERKLSDIANYRNGKAHEQYIDMNGIYTVVNSKFISTNGKVKKFSNKPIELLKKGEITFVLSDVPNGKALAKTYLIDSDNKYSLNQRIAGITPSSDINSYFLYILMNRNRYFLKFDDGVGQTNLSKKDIEEFKENYPLFDEQQKIANLFSKIQTLITRQQNKLTQLIALKKYLLQNLFI